MKIGTASTFKPDSYYGQGSSWADCVIRTNNVPSFAALFENEILSVISEVNVLSGAGNRAVSEVSSSANKLFLPAEFEFKASTETFSSVGIAECPLGQFDYYSLHNASEYRAKTVIGSTTGRSYWFRSPRRGSKNDWCGVDGSGNYSTTQSTTSRGISPIFAI